MPDHRRPPHRRGPPHHHNAGWLYNFEADLPLAEGVALLSKILSTLSERGEVTIQGTKVAPPATPAFVIRYEEAPHGEMMLKLEIKWEPHDETLQVTDCPPQIN